MTIYCVHYDTLPAVVVAMVTGAVGHGWKLHVSVSIMSPGPQSSSVADPEPQLRVRIRSPPKPHDLSQSPHGLQLFQAIKDKMKNSFYRIYCSEKPDSRFIVTLRWN